MAVLAGPAALIERRKAIARKTLVAAWGYFSASKLNMQWVSTIQVTVHPRTQVNSLRMQDAGCHYNCTKNSLLA